MSFRKAQKRRQKRKTAVIGGGGGGWEKIPEDVRNNTLQAMLGNDATYHSLNRRTKCQPNNCDPLPNPGTKCHKWCIDRAEYHSEEAQAAREQEVFDAIIAYDLEWFKKAIRRPATNLNRQLWAPGPNVYQDGNTPLIVTTRLNGRQDFTRELLTMNSVDVNIINGSQESALTCSINGQDIMSVRLLSHADSGYQDLVSLLLTINPEFIKECFETGLTFGFETTEHAKDEACGWIEDRQWNGKRIQKILHYLYGNED